MKYIIALLAASLFSSTCFADCLPQAKVANSFMNAYKKHCDESLNNRTKETTDQWIQRNSQVTKSFKSAYKELVAKAYKDEPEMGLGFDPIFDAQDYPDKGLTIARCDEKSNLVTLKGKNWETYEVVVKTIKSKNGWLVDGAGVINIPKNQQAHRD